MDLRYDITHMLDIPSTSKIPSRRLFVRYVFGCRTTSTLKYISFQDILLSYRRGKDKVEDFADSKHFLPAIFILLLHLPLPILTIKLIRTSHRHLIIYCSPQHILQLEWNLTKQHSFYERTFSCLFHEA